MSPYFSYCHWCLHVVFSLRTKRKPYGIPYG
nr:MAG TPA: hypothetical protein [Caudoviricetes sp.]DAK54493.1 MAG TPA: hypothetical protein [Caudoviricetes sp.]DAN25385.1 MAG TPA: hypothetical protein [Caudoviricetes sp.]DAR77390.1 MAG TPA: hypothetical protein [Caudoviricetes sp.]DAY09121.1 MAG TPA: hypothetical protein [Caudoviricetes sp.]